MGCDYRGWVGLGNLRANGHPSGGPWRQFHCTVCQGYFPEHHGTLFYGKRVSVDLIVHVIGCLAEGLAIRGTARVFEVDPNTVLHWLMEAAEQLRAFAQYFLYDLHLTQVQLDELYAVLSALKEGTLSEEGAIERLSRSPHWVWAAMDPGGPGVGARLCTAVPDGWLQGVRHSSPGPFRRVGATAAPPGHRAGPEAALDAPATASLRPSHQDRAPAAPRQC
jgi:transposase-like protein